jgi:hypothetical protein
LNSFSCKNILFFLPSNMAAITWSCKTSIHEAWTSYLHYDIEFVKQINTLGNKYDKYWYQSFKKK